MSIGLTNTHGAIFPIKAMKTKTVFLNKWVVLVVGVLLVIVISQLGVDGAYIAGKSLFYLVLALVVLSLFGLRFHIR